MRVIDQYGIKSIDMDDVVVSVSEDTVIFDMSMRDGSVYVMGRYKSHERAKEVFIELHDAYSTDICKI